MQKPKFFLKSLAWLLIFQLSSAPGLVVVAAAQDAPVSSAASDDEVQTVQQLATDGYLGDQKDRFLKAKSLTEDDVTDAILKADDKIMALDMKGFQANKDAYQIDDLQSLLDLVKDKVSDIRARKASAWKLENRLEKMIALMSMASTAPTAAATVSITPETSIPTATAVPPTPTATPIPGPSREEFSELKESFKTLDRKLSDMQADLDKKTKTIEDLRSQGQDAQAATADVQEQLKLVKKLLDRVQEDMKKSEEHVEAVEKKVEEKMTIDTQMQQEITVMHKDLRDDTEDISVLKEQVAKLDKTDYGEKNALDEFLTSKWLSGGALIVGLTALTISLTRH